VLKWVFERVTNPSGDNYNKAALGLAPRQQDLDLSGLSLSDEQFAQLIKLDAAEWRQEIGSQSEFFASLGNHLPAELVARQTAILSAFTTNVAPT
jgi:phosphoenolpyruvate carboxykinase (GTP)